MYDTLLNALDTSRLKREVTLFFLLLYIVCIFIIINCNVVSIKRYLLIFICVSRKILCAFTT